MRGQRNPFRLRRSESINAEDAFLVLFEPGILAVLPRETLWDSVHIIRSAAGGGKTSLIRLFTPASLNTLCRRGRANSETGTLYQQMREFDAVDEVGPRVLGVLLTCGPGYSMLEELAVDRARKMRLFFGLLNARIVLAVLRGALQLKELPYPQGLAQLTIQPSQHVPVTEDLLFPCSGDRLYAWAQKREAALCNSLDSLGPLSSETLPGDDDLYSLSMLGPANLLLGGKSVAPRVLLMMDDIHKLTAEQRTLLVKTVIDARSTVGVWIAERFEALSPQEMFSSGADQGRDYGQTVEIERFWRAKPERFEKLATQVADRRISEADGSKIDSFASCLQETLQSATWDAMFAEITAVVASRVKERFGGKDRFRDWIAIREQSTELPQQQAIGWRELEILIERELKKKQKSLFDDHPLGEEILAERGDASLRNAAELFLAQEHGIPYFYGAERVSRLASLNIQQFLGLGAEVFEEATAAEVLRRQTHSLAPERQHQIMKTMAKQLWDSIPSKARHGRALQRFLESIGNFCKDYTYQPTAPNDWAVTGTAIRMSERSQLFDAANNPSKANEGMVRLGSMLSSALAHNLLVAQLDYNCKGDRWMVLNLNRLLCVHFDLPLSYGLYKERPLRTLIKWLDHPFTPAADGELL